MERTEYRLSKVDVKDPELVRAVAVAFALSDIFITDETYKKLPKDLQGYFSRVHAPKPGEMEALSDHIEKHEIQAEENKE